MRLLPYRRFNIETRLAPAQVQARLRDAIAVKLTCGFAAGSVFLSAAVRSVANGQLDPVVLPALGVLAFLTAMTLGGFVMEVNQSFRELVQWVDASDADLR